MITYAEDPRYGYLVLSGCTGGELFDRIASDTATEGDAAMAVLDVLSALTFLHSKRIMHRDLKPENLMYKDDQPGSPIKVIDFGIAAQLAQGVKISPEVVGTTSYMAPEVLQERGGLLCDMWSLGVIGFFVLSGRLPFPGRTEEDKEDAIMRGKYSMSSTRWAQVSADAKDFVSKLLVPFGKRPSAKEASAHKWIVERTKHTELLGNEVAKSLKQHADANRFQKVVRHQMATSLTGPELHQLRNLFEGIDADRSGTVTVKELEAVVGEHAHVSAIDFRAFDVDGDGVIDYKEFVGAALQEHTLHNEENLESIFKRLDTDGSGTLCAKEIAKTLGNDEQLAREILASVGDGDLVMTLSEFKEHMMAKAPIEKKAPRKASAKALAADADAVTQQI